MVSEPLSISFDSSSLTMAVAPSLQPVSKKLTRENFLVWKALVSSALRGAQLHEFLNDGVEFPSKELTLEDKKTTIPNPEYVRMVAKEQQVLHYLLSSLSQEILQQAATYTTLAEVWEFILSSFASQSHAVDDQEGRHVRQQVHSQDEGSHR
jgi:hypothetical protein